MEKKIEAIVIDIDGCVLDTKKGAIVDSYGTLRICQQVTSGREGHSPEVFLCTGRDRNYVEAVGQFIGTPRLAVIEHGAYLFDLWTEKLIPNPIVASLEQRLSREEVLRFLAECGGWLYPGKDICFTLYPPERMTIPDFCQLTLKAFQAYPVEIVYSNIAVDVTPKGLNKGEGVKFLAQKARINLSKAVGIGDSRGDFSWLSLVGQVGCPANSSGECVEFVTKRGGYVSPLTFASGVADVIDHFVGKG